MSEVSSRPERRSRGFGVFFLLLAAIGMLFLLGASGTEATFLLNDIGADAIRLPDLVVPVLPTVVVVVVLLAAAGGVQIARGFGRRTYLVLGLVVAAFVFAFLTWAARDQSLNLIAILRLTVRGAVPLTFGALSGVLCERSGVINIAIEGQFLLAAFTGAVVSSVFDSAWLGLVGGAAAGALLGAILAVLSIRYRADQIIVGVVLIVFATGLTAFLTSQLLVPNPDLNTPAIFTPVAIPLVSEIPIIGPLFFRHTIFVYGMFAAVFAVHWGLFSSRWGLRTLAVGEHPKAADTVGINVYATRYRAVILGGAVAGIGGAFFTLDSATQFTEDMTAGLGFISLAAMIVGRWRPFGAFGAALLFGFATALSGGLAIVQVPIPSEFLLMLPYIVTIFVVAGLVGRPRPPAADGQPYIKEG